MDFMLIRHPVPSGGGGALTRGRAHVHKMLAIPQFIRLTKAKIACIRGLPGEGCYRLWCSGVKDQICPECKQMERK